MRPGLRAMSGLWLQNPCFVHTISLFMIHEHLKSVNT